MFGRHDAVGRAEQRVAAGREDGELLIGAVDLKDDIRTDRFADPVSLHLLGGVRPVDKFEVLEQALGILGDLQHPLAHVLAHDRESADFRFAVDDFLVGKHRAKFRTPVDRHLGDIGKTAVVQLQEDPLRPLVVIGITGSDFPVPVIGKSERFDLFAEMVDIRIGEHAGMVARLQRILFRRKSERIESHRVKDVVSLHALHPCNNVAGGVTLRMTDVQTLSARIRKHVQNVVLRLRLVFRVGAESAVFLPELLPFLFNTLVIVHSCSP